MSRWRREYPSRLGVRSVVALLSLGRGLVTGRARGLCREVLLVSERLGQLPLATSRNLCERTRGGAKASTGAPFPRSCRATASCPFSRAFNSGVQPFLSFTSTAAPSIIPLGVAAVR